MFFELSVPENVFLVFVREIQTFDIPMHKMFRLGPLHAKIYEHIFSQDLADAHNAAILENSSTRSSNEIHLILFT